MRNFIFEFPQFIAVDYGLKVEDLLLLSYFYKFFEAGRADYKFDPETRERWWFICYSKIKKDLPILGSISKIRRMFRKLEAMYYIKTRLYNGRNIHIKVNWKKCFRGKYETDSEVISQLNVERF